MSHAVLTSKEVFSSKRNRHFLATPLMAHASVQKSRNEAEKALI